MTRSEQKYQKAIKMIAEEYRKAQASCYIRKPISYALYQVWKYFNMHETSRYSEGEE